MPKRISAADATPISVAIVTLDDHLAEVVARAEASLRRGGLPGLSLSLHSAAQWGEDEAALTRCNRAIATADIVIVTMMFMEDHIKAVLPTLQARRDACDAMVVCMSASEVAKLTRMGRFTTHSTGGGLRDLMKKMRGKTEKSGTAGADQMKMLRRIPKILKFIPGMAQDLRAYLLTLQYWLAGSDENIANLVAFLVNRYADGPRKHLRGVLTAGDPVEYPEVGVYHPRLAARVSADLAGLAAISGPKPAKGRVGIIVMRSYLLAKNTRHYDGVIAALEAKGLEVVPVFASGLDARPAIEQFFLKNGVPQIDALVSLTGFSLVGGPAYNDAKAAEDLLARLDVPYVAAHPVEFQTLEQWGASERGLMPVEATIMVAIPELDGATGPMVFGGRSDAAGEPCTGCARSCVFSTTDGARDMHACAERAEALAARVASQIVLRRAALSERKIAIVLFNFPPNAGNTGTAAFLSVFESLWNTLNGLKKAGYAVDLPTNVDALRDAVIAGNSAHFGTFANMHHRISADEHVRREPYLSEIEAQWGPAPGRQQSDGTSIFVLGRQFGNVFVGIQPAFGYEGDPMRLLFEKGFTPTHAFSAFYRYLREDFAADAVLHFGTHGALEFMPGKQVGMTASDWPDRMIGNLPNLYLYAANNPSEGTIAKRRSGATLISYLTSPVAQAGLYRGLLDLKASLDTWRAFPPEAVAERAAMVGTLQAQAAAVDLAEAEPAWSDDALSRIEALSAAILELEYTLIPHGLHVVGATLSAAERIDMLQTVAEGSFNAQPGREALAALVDGIPPETAANLIEDNPEEGLAGSERTIAMLRELAKTDKLLAEDHEVPAIIRALDGRYLRPAPGGDLLRTPEILPTGRNLNGFDPFRIPSAFAVRDGEKQAARLIARHMADGNAFPQSIALVLWGTDNLKSQGGPIAQALALIGARPRFDNYGRLAGAELVPLEELGRPRIDVVMTLSGIFRDLLPLQTRLLAEASFLAASADEPAEQNFIRRHALAYAAANDCDMETAALRVFGNADGAYGANVNHLIENSRWDGDDELAETYSRRKCFAYGRTGRPMKQPELLKSVLSGIDLAYQNLESVELGVTTLDQYFDTLGGISRSAKRAGGREIKVYIGDQTRGEGQVRTLDEQVSLETRTRVLNPKWYEGMLKHGYEGVRHIETTVTNTMGWSATTGQVAPWVYQQITETFVLDETMRERLATLNPTSAAKVANRLIEAQQRNYWSPSPETLQALQEASEALEDRIEGIGLEVAA